MSFVLPYVKQITNISSLFLWGDPRLTQGSSTDDQRSSMGPWGGFSIGSRVLEGSLKVLDWPQGSSTDSRFLEGSLRRLLDWLKGPWGSSADSRVLEEGPRLIQGSLRVLEGPPLTNCARERSSSKEALRRYSKQKCTPWNQWEHTQRAKVNQRKDRTRIYYVSIFYSGICGWSDGKISVITLWLFFYECAFYGQENMVMMLYRVLNRDHMDRRIRHQCNILRIIVIHRSTKVICVQNDPKIYLLVICVQNDSKIKLLELRIHTDNRCPVTQIHLFNDYRHVVYHSNRLETAD